MEEPIRYVVLDLPEVNEEDTSEEAVTEQPVRRSERVRQRPNYYGEWASSITEQVEPQTVKEALTDKQKSKWERAMEAEMQSLKDNDVWELEHRKLIGSKCMGFQD